MFKDKYKLDSSKTLKSIDITAVRDGKTEAILGIYSLDRDTLKICQSDAGKPRPTEFVTKQDEKRSLATLERIKK